MDTIAYDAERCGGKDVRRIVVDNGNCLTYTTYKMSVPGHRLSTARPSQVAPSVLPASRRGGSSKGTIYNAFVVVRMAAARDIVSDRFAVEFENAVTDDATPLDNGRWFRTVIAEGMSSSAVLCISLLYIVSPIA